MRLVSLTPKRTTDPIRSFSPFSRLHCSLDHEFIVRIDSYEDDKESNCRLVFMEVGASRRCLQGGRAERNRGRSFAKAETSTNSSTSERRQTTTFPKPTSGGCFLRSFKRLITATTRSSEATTTFRCRLSTEISSQRTVRDVGY